MSDDRKDLPPANSPNFLARVREVLMVYLGSQGDKLDRGLTLRDLAAVGMIDLSKTYLAGQRSARPVAGVGLKVEDAYEADLTPPPTPTGFAVSAAISNILIEHAAPTYTQGHGHAKTVVYGASWTSGPLPTFANAIKLTEFSGTVFANATNPATTWHLWIKWETKDGVLSVTPAGGTNGLVVTTGQDVTKMVTALTGPGNPFKILTAPVTLPDGSVAPAGTYTSDAYIHNGQIVNAMIANLAVDNAKIANLAVSKLTAGSIAVGQYIQSSGYIAGSAGWRINGDGNAEFSGVVVRGTVYATAGQIGGNSIDASGMQSATYTAGASGWRLASNGTGQIGGLTVGTNYIQSNNYVAGSAGWKLGNDGTLEASSGTFRGALGGATGTFSGSLSAASGTFSGTLTAGAINAVNTINIAGNAVTVPQVSSSASNSASTSITLAEATVVIIWGVCSGVYLGTGGRTMKITVDGTDVKSVFSNSSGGVTPTIVLPIVHHMSLAAGTHTITASVNEASTQETTVIVMAAKR